MDFIDKKENIADAIEKYVLDKSKKVDLLNIVSEGLYDDELMAKGLFRSILTEIKKDLDKLSDRELKQRILMIRTYMD